jgi:hypothetical protein
MSEEMRPIIKFAEDQPHFMALLCVGLLFKLAGQQTFTIQELHDYNKEFIGIRIMNDTNEPNIADRTVTVTLQKGENT